MNDAVLTWRQSRVFRFIRDYQEQNGVAPNLREIGDAAGLASISSVYWVVGKLIGKGYLEARQTGNRPRYVVVAAAHQRKIPVSREDLITLLEETAMIHGWDGAAGRLAHEARHNS